MDVVEDCGRLFMNSPKNVHMEKFHNRLHSFLRGWKSRASPTILASAGMFFVGEGDRTACWYCNCPLENWLPDDSPWVEHAKWFPNCDFLLLHKGFDFLVSHVRNRFSASAAINNGSISPSERNVLTSEIAKDVFLCKICYNEKINCVFVPCGHAFSCWSCSVKVLCCPVCRVNFTAIQQIFIS